jgi:hypothetical protein
MSSKTLEEKGEAILETIRNVREKHREMDEKLQQLVRIATYYSHGIDPQEIEYPVTRQWDQTVEGMVATVNMRDGSVHRIPVKELE